MKSATGVDQDPARCPLQKWAGHESNVDLLAIVPDRLKLALPESHSHPSAGCASASLQEQPKTDSPLSLAQRPNDLGQHSGILHAYPLPARSEMASSLPYDVGASKSSKPAKGRLGTLTNELTVTSSADDGSESTLFRRRATTTNSATPGSLLDRRSKTATQPVQTFPKLQIHTDPSVLSKGHDAPQTHPVGRSSIPDDRPSAPIDIPIRKSRSSQPTTPLTGRERSFFPHSPKESHTPPAHSNDKGFTPSPNSHSSQSEREQFAHSPINRRNMRTDCGGASPRYTPSSPLSPTKPGQSIPSIAQQNAGPHSKNQHNSRQVKPLTIPTLPPYHPANYESRNPSPRTSRSAISSHGRQLSDAQKMLQRHQRDLVINATRTASLTNIKSPKRRPSSPRLNPRSSPGPITPLMLEGQTDYFLGGPNAAAASTSTSKGSEHRETVDRLIGGERDRIRHPERTEQHSPAVSPAA
ncbi:MAG: hypothetical protein Q9201_007068 [Fulgogasparrea decipioides]